MVDGQAYVKVQADVGNDYAKDINGSSVGGGSVSGSYILNWTFANGFTNYTWTIPEFTNPTTGRYFPPITITPIANDVDGTNQLISENFYGKASYYTNYIIDDLSCGMSV